MKNIKLVIEYDGTNYLGWQKQKNGITVQSAVEEAIHKLTKETVEVIGCSRTDSGVHAEGYVCNFKTNSKVPTEKFKEALNFHLPEDIAVLQCEEVGVNFHARYDSKGKMYCYTILNTNSRRPLARNYSYHYKGALDYKAMMEAAKYFEGTHDFAAFRNVGSSVKTSERTISLIKVERDDEFIKVYVAADGFLYNMARIIVGTLIEVGNGKKNPKDINSIIESKDRTKAGKTSPPQGLSLLEVYY